jgi:hypothetical protein
MREERDRKEGSKEEGGRRDTDDEITDGGRRHEGR